MQAKRKQLEQIAKDLEGFMGTYCNITPGHYDDFVGESCDAAYQMLQDTLRRMDCEADSKSHATARHKTEAEH